jgi:hypothetical protein
MDQVLLDCAEREPLYKTICLPIVEYTKQVSISPITRMTKLLRVEYPICNYIDDPIYRSYHRNGNLLTLKIDSVPTIDKETLTGTFTFTKDSRTVTATSGAFTTELASNKDNSNGDLICVSTGSQWYQVAHCDSATSLTLAEPFEQETVTDVASATLRRSYKSCVRVHYGAEYTLTRSYVTFSGSGLDDLQTNDDYSGTDEDGYIVEVESTASTDKFKWSNSGGASYTTGVSMTTSAQTLANAVTVYWTAKTGHTAGDKWSFTAKPTDVPGYMEGTVIQGVVAYAALQYQTILTETETALDQAVTYQQSSTGVINTVNVGGDVALKYAELSKISVALAQARISKGMPYKQWAELQWNKYQSLLKRLGRFSDDIRYPGVRAV